MKKLINWLAACAVITVVFVAIYSANQQSLRQGAYDPQIQLAEDTATALANGTNSFNALSGQPASVDMTKSLAPFYFVYNDSGKVIQTNANLAGMEAPAVPSGVLSFAQKHGEDKLSWQPDRGLRFALVAVHYSSSQGSGTIVVARSMREVEKRIEKVALISLLSWLICIAIVTGRELWQHETKKRR